MRKVYTDGVWEFGSPARTKDADHEMSELDELEDEPSVSGSTIAARETTESATVCSANVYCLL